MALDVPDITGGYGNPALPEGEAADPTYLAFLRGMGMDQATAWSTAIQHVAAIKADYQTAVSRDPQTLHDELRQTNAGYSGNGTWFSGQRLQDVAETRTKDQQRLDDFKTAEATGLQNEHDQLAATLQQLARNNIDQQGALRERTDNQHNQDEYIRAVAAANQPKAPTAPATPLPGATPAAAPAAAPGGGVQAQLAAMSPAQQAAFKIYTAGQPKPAAPKPMLVGPGQYRG